MNGPQDHHNIILNQLLDHPLKLQKNLRQRSFIVASEWLQESVSRTCFPVRTKDPFSAAMRINLHHHCRQRQQPQFQRLVKRVSITPRSLKISEGSEKKFYKLFFNVNFKGLMNWFSLKNTASCTTFVHGSKKILHNSFWKPDIKFQTHPGMSTYSTHQLSKLQTHPGMFTQIF